jgi:hypothetical protein
VGVAVLAHREIAGYRPARVLAVPALDWFPGHPDQLSRVLGFYLPSRESRSGRFVSSPSWPAKTLKAAIRPTGRAQGNRTGTDSGKQRLCGIRGAPTITAGGYRGFAGERYEALRLISGCAWRLCLS